MAVTKILVDGVPVPNLTTPVKVTLSGTGMHKIQYEMNTDTIKKDAFKGCDIEKITIPHSINTIKEDAFKDSQVSEIVFQGTTAKTLEQNALPQGVTLIASHETIGRYSEYNPQEATSKTGEFVSDVPVGYVLYESGSGELYAAEYNENNNDTALGVCVIPKGMFDNHAHFISLENIAYDDSGNVIHVSDHYNQWCMFAPNLTGGDGFRWHDPNIECYSQIPYCGLLFHQGELDGPIIYDTIEEMPDILGTNKPSGNMNYTEAVDFRFTYDLLGIWDWSDKSRSHFVECCQDGIGDTYTLPGGNSMTNPYYRGSGYVSQTVMPCATSDQSDHKYFYDRHYYSPSPYLQVAASDEVVANPILLKELAPSPNLLNDRGNPYRFFGSANEFLIPNIINKCTKPTVNTNEDYYTVWQVGTADGGTPTFFPAPYCCYEYAPGTGGTLHQWALGTPLEWICAFAKFAKIQNVISKLTSPMGQVAADYIQGNISNSHSSSSGFYWGGLMANDGLVYLMDGNSRRVENMTTSDQPRLSTRPFIVL